MGDEGVEPPHATIVPQACFSDDLRFKLSPAVEPLKRLEPASRAPQACFSDNLRSKLSPAVEPLKTFKPASRAPQASAQGMSPATAAAFSRAAALAERVQAMDKEAPVVSLSQGRM